MIVANFRGSPYLFENRSAPRSWLKVSLEGTTSNRTGFGSVVSVRAGKNVYHRHYDGVDFLGQSIQPLHFGLAFASMADEVVVKWPNGRIEAYYDISLNQTFDIVEGQGTTVSVEDDLPGQHGFELLGAFPNPFMASTQIEFRLPAAGTATLRIYDVLGRQVRAKEVTYTSGGVQRLSLDTKDIDLWLSIQRYPDDTTLFWSPEVPATYGSLIGFTYLTGKGQGRHRYTSLEIPSWFLMLIFATAPAVWLYKWNKRRKFGPNACPACGYDLTGNESGVCPECGKRTEVATNSVAGRV